MKNQQIADIAFLWIIRLKEKGKDQSIAWELYDLACGRSYASIDRIKDWVLTLDQGNEQVKTIMEWINETHSLRLPKKSLP